MVSRRTELLGLLVATLLLNHSQSELHPPCACFGKLKDDIRRLRVREGRPSSLLARMHAVFRL